MNTKSSIFNLILGEGPVLREKIISKSGLGKVTVGKAIRELMQERKVIEDGKVSQGKGRAKKILKVNPDLYYILTVFYNGIQFTGGIVNLDKKLIYQCSSTAKKDNSAFVAEFISFIKQVQKEAKINEKKVLGIGVSIPGSFDTKEGKVLGIRGKKQWKDVRLKEILREEFKKEVFLIDDTDVLARVEYEARKEEGIKNLLYVYLGEGIGLGTILNRKLYSGSTGNAGEIGHLIVGGDGKRCYCGNYGCLETFSSVGSIIKDVKKGIQEGVHSVVEKIVDGDLNKINIEVIAQSIEEGDKLSRDVVEKSAEYIGKVSAILVNIFNPEILVFGGPLTKTGSILFSTIESCIMRESSPVSLRNIRIEFSMIGEDYLTTGISLPCLDNLKEERWENWQ